MRPSLAPSRLGAALVLLACACSSAQTETASPEAIGFDRSFLDPSADPCTDFYQFACGTWIAQHPAPTGYAVQRFASGDQREDLYFSQLVEAMSSSDPGLQSAQSYYASCLNAQNRSRAQPGALGAELSSITAMSSLADLPNTLASLQRSGVSALMALSPQIDPGDPTREILDISAHGWTLPAASSYQDSDLAAAYQLHMTALAQAAESAGLSVSIDAAQVFALERDLAAAGAPESEPTAVHDPVAEYNPIDADGLASALPGFDWTAYTAKLGFRGLVRANRISADFLPALAGILAATPLPTLKQYLVWRALEADASYVDQPLIDEEFHFHRTVLRGQPQNHDEDAYWCLLGTRNWFGFELAQHFVQKFVPSSVKPDATALVESVRQAMRANLSQVSWLDDATRAQAQAKLELLLPKVAYPDAWPTDQVSFGAADTYLDKFVGLVGHAEDLAAARLASPVDRSEFWASPEITNAFYSPARNDITIPVAVLQDPFFNPARPAAFTSGALGSVIGHELTHAFDSNGRHFDGTGTLTDWWTEAAAAEFEARAQCLVDQYSGYEALPGQALNGQATLNENIADLGGLKLAYAAFEATLPSTGAPGFTAEQQFFLSYAQLWCASVSDQASTLALAIDPHSPPKFRVNGVATNLPQFAQAFSCPAGAPLAPTDRCEIW